jgi:hypothetical protein
MVRMKKKNIIHNSTESKIIYDPSSNIAYKTVKTKEINEQWIAMYKEFQKTAPVVKIIDMIDSNTYTMEYIPNIIATVDSLTRHWAKEHNFIRTKNNFINLHNCITESWQCAMRISKGLEQEMFWASEDLKLANIVVIKDKHDKITFKLIDADSWQIRYGYQSVDTFYQSQLKIALVMQRFI